MNARYDIVIIGGGHAGCEAAWAAARLGARALLMTLSRNTIAAMSCNPSVGGPGKGHLVMEIDALGGLMGLASDATGIQFRRLNTKKGAAVRARRAQSDRARYAEWMQDKLGHTQGLQIVEDEAVDIRVIDGQRGKPAVSEVVGASGKAYPAAAVVLSAGTFLRGLMHIGMESTRGGRHGDPAAYAMSECLERLGFSLGRLKTGTCPRLHADSID